MNRTLPIMLTLVAAMALLTGCQSACDAALNGVRDHFERCGEPMASEFQFHNCESDPDVFTCAEACVRRVPCDELTNRDERLAAFGGCLASCE